MQENVPKNDSENAEEKLNEDEWVDIENQEI